MMMMDFLMSLIIPWSHTDNFQQYIWSHKVILIIRNFLEIFLLAPASLIFPKVKVDRQKKAQTNKCLQTMPSKKISTLFIITLHIFSHFARIFICIQYIDYI